MRKCVFAYYIFLLFGSHTIYMKFLAYVLKTGPGTKKIYMDLRQLSSYNFLPSVCVAANFMKHFERGKNVSICMRFCLFQSLQVNICLVCFTCYNYYEIVTQFFNFVLANLISRFFYEPRLNPGPGPGPGPGKIQVKPGPAPAPVVLSIPVASQPQPDRCDSDVDIQV